MSRTWPNTTHQGRWCQSGEAVLRGGGGGRGDANARTCLKLHTTPCRWCLSGEVVSRGGGGGIAEGEGGVVHKSLIKDMIQHCTPGQVVPVT
jgi:hypothetical protein